MDCSWSADNIFERNVSSSELSELYLGSVSRSSAPPGDLERAADASISSFPIFACFVILSESRDSAIFVLLLGGEVRISIATSALFPWLKFPRELLIVESLVSDAIRFALGPPLDLPREELL